MSSTQIKVENLITYDDILSTSRRCHYNKFISEFYVRFADDNRAPIKLADDGEIVYGKDPNFVRRAERVKTCCNTWTFDFFNISKYKNLIRVDRCKDKFCLNCQSLVADQRLYQYEKVLDEYADTNDLYHMVFTVPNVDADKLPDTITLMLDRFAYLIRYFQCSKKIAGVDFSKYGYIGAVRSLEITVSKRNGTYHPHLHTMFILKKGLNMEKIFWNSFSVDKYGRQDVRLFSNFEMLLQRIWCLLMMRVEVNAENINDIYGATGYRDGFSCMADLSNGKYHEIFKYAIKGSFKNETLFTYENFLTLYRALYNRKCYQTYGCLSRYDFNDYDESLGLNSPDEAFELFLTHLSRLERPERIDELLSSILKSLEKEEYKYISRATFSRHFRALSEEDKKEIIKKVGEKINEVIPKQEKIKT